MKIVHFCLSCFYIDGYAYQENQLVAQHVAMGHEVTVIASTEVFDDRQQVAYTQPKDYIGTDGARVIRLKYRENIPLRIAAKIRAYPQVAKILDQLKPDIILFHGLCAWELLTIAKYVKQNTNVVLYADCHEDFNNSARSFVSKWVLHYFFYRKIIHRSLPFIRKVLCISQESLTFTRDFYGISPALLEFFPLGGEILDDIEYATSRNAIRTKFQWDEQNLVFVQSGKIDRAKRLTDSIRAFSAIKGSHLRFVIAGKIMPDVENEIRILINADNRILETGWLQTKELQALLCAADVYVQPGSQSATMQMSLCCRCPVILDDVPSHRALFSNNGYLVSDPTSLTDAMHKIATIPRKALQEMSLQSVALSKKYLDYRLQALRILQ